MQPSAAFDFDFIVIGSGFGGSVAAHRLTEKGYLVAVIEMGRRWTPDSLPATNWRMSRWIWRPKLGLRGFFNIEPFRHVVILHGCAVGGGSITYACTSLVPPECVWQGGSWTGLTDWTAEMPAHYAEASRMLGVAPNRVMGPADQILEEAAGRAGAGHTFYRTQVAIYQGADSEPPGTTHPDPYFHGDGPERATCVGCGGCMMGCRYNAKNTLDKNYLYLAEKHGASVFPETRVVDVAPLNGRADGADGYEIRTVSSTAWIAPQQRRFTCRGVIFAASALGTMDLLFRLKQRGSLPRIGDTLGTGVRTNAESLIAVRTPGIQRDISRGVAIGSGIYLDEHTHIEVVRYPAGSDAMGLLATMLTDKRGRGRVLYWLVSLAASLVRHPWRTVRCLHPFGFARETLILLCMHTRDAHIRMRLGRPWFWPFQKVLMSSGKRVPTFMPEANRFARSVAALTGGVPLSMVTEILFDVPGTAHVLGGCPMSASSGAGVVDQRHRLFGYRNAYVCDGSVISANLGVNPSLTITALAERAMSYIPPAASNDWNDVAPQS
jgi:cholesterol oxidase